MKTENNSSIFFNINAYISVFLLLVVAGGSLPFMLYPKTFLTLFFVFSFLTRMTSRIKFRWTSQYNYFLWLLFFFTVSSLYNDSYDQDYKRFLFMGLVSCFLLGSFTLSRFKHVYLNVVTIFCVVSLLIFCTSLIISLPLKYHEGNNQTTGYFLFHTIEWNYQHLLRNSSIYNEPGCFQYFLNYVLLLHIEDAVHYKLKRNTIIKITLVIISLLTCASTVGYFVLISIITYVLVKIKIKNWLLYVCILLPLFILLVWTLYNTDSIKGKFDTGDKTKSVSFVMRTADAYAMIQMISDHPFVGNGGIFTSTYIKRVQRYGALTPETAASNGILAGMASMGIFWLIIFFIYSIKSLKRIFKNTSLLVLFLLILLIQSNEFYIFFPITYVFLAFYHDNINSIGGIMRKLQTMFHQKNRRRWRLKTLKNLT